MNQHFQGRSFLAEKDFSKAELEYLIDFSAHLKELKKAGLPHQYLKGKNIVLLFEKASTRTRAAFTTAAIDLGAHPEYLGKNDIQLGKKESVKDTAKVLGSMFDGIEFRGFSQGHAEELASYAGVPVWNGLTDDWHPTQMLADYLTIKENFGYLEGINLVYLGDGRNNVASSLLVTGAILGVNVSICAPAALQPTGEIRELAESFAKESGSQVTISADIEPTVNGADVLYTDVWFSMGEEDKIKDRLTLLQDYQINRQMVNLTNNPQVIVLHCLPAFHNTETTYGQEIKEKYGLSEMEISDDIFNSHFGRQFQQAENRMHSIKSVMAATLGHLFIPEL